MMTLAVVASSLVVVAWALAAACLPRALAAVPRADSRAPDAGGDRGAAISVIVPARNEEALLDRCLASLEAQEHRAVEIIVVDDGSTDATRSKAQRATVVIAAPPPPEGWAGKCWAAWQGAQAARGEWLLFLDADAVLAPQCLGAALVGAAEADLLALYPRPRCATILEAIVQPVMLMLMLWRDDPRRLNDARDSSAAAPGSFLLFRRDAYHRIGGHHAVRGEVVEDRKLAERVKRHGLRLRVIAAPHLIETSRPLTLRGLWNGWSRVSPEGMSRRFGMTAFASGAVQTLFLLPYTLAPLGGWLPVLAVLHFGLVLAVRVQLRRAYGIDARFAWLQPVGALFAIAVLLRATAPGAVHWRGRRWRA